MQASPRLCCRATLLAAALAATGSAQAQEFPSKPLRIIVPYAAGGVPDPLTRTLGAMMSPLLGQQIIVENKPGAGGVPAMQELMRAPADGYTLSYADAGLWAVQPALRPGIYDPLKEMTPLGTAVMSIIFVVAREDLGVKSMQELVALAKSRPGKLSYGSSGSGSLHHLFMESVKAHYGVDLVHVPYKAATQAMQALLAGDLAITMASAAASAPFAKSGKIRVILAATQQRSQFLPEVPSMGDLKLETTYSGSIGYIAPGGTPRAVVDRLASALATVVKTDEFAKRAEGFFVEVDYRTPAQHLELMRQDIARYARAVKISGAKAE
jgi:tripartite-type tricarboxylate transporter receptor subunit TctC